MKLKSTYMTQSTLKYPMVDDGRSIDSSRYHRQRRYRDPYPYPYWYPYPCPDPDHVNLGAEHCGNVIYYLSLY